MFASADNRIPVIMIVRYTEESEPTAVSTCVMLVRDGWDLYGR